MARQRDRGAVGQDLDLGGTPRRPQLTPHRLLPGWMLSGLGGLLMRLRWEDAAVGGDGCRAGQLVSTLSGPLTAKTLEVRFL